MLGKEKGGRHDPPRLSFSCIARSLVVFRPVGSRALETLNKSAGGLEQDGGPMKIQELFLAAAERSHIDNLRRIYAHSLERGTMSNRGDYELPVTVVLETNEPTIKEMIDARCQNQSVLAL